MSAADEATAVNIAANLEDVRSRISKVATSDVRLVAVSKTKPNELLQQAYDAGQRVFGENYVKELVAKAAELPKDIQWHFIGPLQSNKANLLVKSVAPTSKLVIETVAALKLAKKLDTAFQAAVGEDDEAKKLSIFVQVNTSGEDSKSGVSPDEVVDLVQAIQTECPRLHIQGLMTIGAQGDMSCFDTLVNCREQVLSAIPSLSPLELSMGMSGDFEQAIERGATNVRVGSTIFGARDYSNRN